MRIRVSYLALLAALTLAHVVGHDVTNSQGHHASTQIGHRSWDETSVVRHDGSSDLVEVDRGQLDDGRSDYASEEMSHARPRKQGRRGRKNRRGRKRGGRKGGRRGNRRDHHHDEGHHHGRKGHDHHKKDLDAVSSERESRRFGFGSRGDREKVSTSSSVVSYEADPMYQNDGPPAASEPTDEEYYYDYFQHSLYGKSDTKSDTKPDVPDVEKEDPDWVDGHHKEANRGSYNVQLSYEHRERLHQAEVGESDRYDDRERLHQAEVGESDRYDDRERLHGAGHHPESDRQKPHRDYPVDGHRMEAPTKAKNTESGSRTQLEEVKVVHSQIPEGSAPAEPEYTHSEDTSPDTAPEDDSTPVEDQNVDEPNSVLVKSPDDLRSRYRVDYKLVVLSPDVCTLSMDIGPCQGSEIRYYYDVLAGGCRHMVYGGCDGNQNNFMSAEECFKVCGGDALVPTHRPPVTTVTEDPHRSKYSHEYSKLYVYTRILV